MSAIIFELKDEHIKLLRNLRWSKNNDNIIVGVADEGDEIAPPFGETNLYEAIDLILNGKPDGVDLLNQEDFAVYTDTQKAVWDKLYSELPTALDIILYNGNLETGTFKTKFHERNWTRIK